eukprot:365366-Chlamydomonas_euryale.AAC.1
MRRFRDGRRRRRRRGRGAGAVGGAPGRACRARLCARLCRARGAAVGLASAYLCRHAVTRGCVRGRRAAGAERLRRRARGGLGRGALRRVGPEPYEVWARSGMGEGLEPYGV